MADPAPSEEDVHADSGSDARSAQSAQTEVMAGVPAEAGPPGGEPLHEFSAGLSVDSENHDSISDLDDLNVMCVPTRRTQRLHAPAAAPNSSRASSKTASSTIFQFVEQFGRTYHRYKEGRYLLPNDERERNRLDLQHYLCGRLLQDRLYLAPLGDVHRVLDMGTGTGLWAMEFAEQHPEADVLGTDLSPIQPEYVAPNVRFEVDDVEDEWLYSAPFDYVHGRCILASVRDIPLLVSRIYENLRPGGHVEFMEMIMAIDAIDGSMADTILPYWQRLLCDGVRRLGREPLLTLRMREMLEAAGFVDVQEKKFAVPVNPWARGDEQKIRGALMLASILDACESITTTICSRVWGWPLEQVEQFVAQVRAALKDRKVHAYIPFFVVYAQKPVDAE